jgi:hypothetical protein
MENIKNILENAEFEVTEKDGVKTLKAKDENLFVEVAKEINPELTKKLLKEVEKVEEEFLSAGLELAKDKAIDEFKASEDIKRIDVVLPFGVNKSDVVTYDVVREKVFPIPGKDEKVRKSVISVDVKKQGCKISKSRIKALEDDISTAIGLK